MIAHNHVTMDVKPAGVCPACDAMNTRFRNRQDPEQVRKSLIAEVAKEVMDGYNHNKHDPSLMAVVGHDTADGFEFFIERDGRTFRFAATLEE